MDRANYARHRYFAWWSSNSLFSMLVQKGVRMKDELREILLGMEWCHAVKTDSLDKAVTEVLELFNKQLPKKIDYQDVYEYKKRLGITVSEAIKEADIYNSCLDDIKSRIEG